MIANYDKLVDWVDIMFKQLHKKLIRCTMAQTNMLQGTRKFDVRKYVCHFTLVIEMLICNIFSQIGIYKCL